MKARELTGKILLDRYELTRFLGAGAFGAVYEARNELGKRFAIKVLLADEVTSDEKMLARFFREAKAAAAIESSHIVDVFETGMDGVLGVPFIVMELLRGEDLEKTIERVGPIDPRAAARIVTQAARGLSQAHAAHVVHRDIKPANLFLSAIDEGDIVVKVLDFGIAKAGNELLTTEQAALTRTGTVMGTPLYMSPEQAQALKTVDERADVWSLGVCLYHALAGVVPWGDTTTLASLFVKICAQDAPPIREVAPWIPSDLARVVQRTLSRAPERRTPSMRALIEDLAPFCGGSAQVSVDMLVRAAGATHVATQPMPEQGSIVALAGSGVSPAVRVPVSRTGPVVALAGGVLVAGAVAFFALSRRERPPPPAAAQAEAPRAEQAAEPPSKPVPTIVEEPPKPVVSTSASATTVPAKPVAKPAAKTKPTAKSNDDPFGGTKN